ncbi:MAG: 2-hydroxyacyl-CoA dehydratase [Clostridia bacterium]|nr:2-hydroxyacyl-CoA dehydratase [Clostridia bacterium]
MEEQKYIPFTEEMKKTYKILVPDMLPMHFKLIIKMLASHGYDMELLTNRGPTIAETGLKYVHNDTCYPAILVIGQFIEAIESGKYDPHKIALIYFQTGGGCRASNYIFLLRKALLKAGYGYIPVISLSLNNLEKHPGFKLGIGKLIRLFYCILYGDMLLSLKNQVAPYEVNKGDAERVANEITEELGNKVAKMGLSFSTVFKNCEGILQRFKEIPVNKSIKPRVGVVGEIYVKFSALGNNGLERFLLSEGAEPVVPGLLDFFLYTVHAKITDYKLFGLNATLYPVFVFLYKFLLKKQKKYISVTKDDGTFDSPTPFEKVVKLVDGYIDTGVKMGEGWLLTAEMLELKERGVKNIVCAQPFGCLPNHICGKGMMKPLKDKNPDMNIVAVDYDAGATKVNQENRIKLMLSCARDELEDQKSSII